MEEFSNVSGQHQHLVNSHATTDPDTVQVYARSGTCNQTVTEKHYLKRRKIRFAGVFLFLDKK